MSLIIKSTCCIVLLSFSSQLLAQNNTAQKNAKQLEIGLAIAGAEAFYYGAYGKYTIPIGRAHHYLVAGIAQTIYFDFTGESEPLGYLTNDVDMRIIPSIFLGYHVNAGKFQIGAEVPLGTSIAITKGTLVNERVGFERTYSNTEFLLHFGVELVAKFSLSAQDKVGLRGFLPLAKDVSWSSPLLGVGWTRSLR